MTKLKSKKMTKSTFAVIIMAILMVAMLAFGGTYAWFTAQAKTIASNGVTTGKIILHADGAFTTSKSVMPGDSLVDSTKAITMQAMEGTDSRGEYVAVKLEISIGNVKSGESITSLVTVTPIAATAEKDGWVKVGTESVSEDKKTVTYYFAYVGNDGSIAALKTEAGAVNIFTDIKFTANDNWTQSSTDTATTTSDNGYMGTTLQLTLNAKGTQVANRDGDNAIASTTALVKELFNVQLA